jgi:hypothetical protein
MTAAHQAHLELQPANDTPDWFKDCRSGQDFFIRPQNDEEMTVLSEIHFALLAPIKTLIEQARLFTDQEALAHQHCLQAYKNHHRHHAPGLRLMNRSFGEQWTADYMNYFFQ